MEHREVALPVFSVPWGDGCVSGWKKFLPKRNNIQKSPTHNGQALRLEGGRNPKEEDLRVALLTFEEPCFPFPSSPPSSLGFTERRSRSGCS